MRENRLLTPIITGKNNNYILTRHSMKTETPKKRPAQGMSNTLKQALNDENYLKALALFERAQKNRLINKLYPEDYE